MTANELIKQLQDFIKENPQFGDAEVISHGEKMSIFSEIRYFEFGFSGEFPDGYERWDEEHEELTDFVSDYNLNYNDFYYFYDFGKKYNPASEETINKFCNKKWLCLNSRY